MARGTPFALWLPLVASLLAGCAERDAEPPKSPAKPPASAATAAPAAAAIPAAAPGHLARREVERVLQQGPPWLLRRVVPEEVIREGKFIGWRILSLPEDWSLDLKSGDVVTKVNGLSIERPDDLWAAWMQLQSAVELRISYERDGRPRDLVMPIDGASGANVLGQMDAPQPPVTRQSRWSTVVIEGDEPVPSSDPPGD
jgi:hypothetical protein